MASSITALASRCRNSLIRRSGELAKARFNPELDRLHNKSPAPETIGLNAIEVICSGAGALTVGRSDDAGAGRRKRALRPSMVSPICVKEPIARS